MATRVNLWLVLASLVASEEVYEPMYSFSSPFMLEAGKLPYWENAGATVITEDFVRLTPAMQSKQGSVWAETPTKFQDWRIVGEFKVGGGGKVGADGFAVWYTKERAEIGPAFGSRDFWTGLGVFFDTFDNDGSRDHPAVYAIYNDGSKSYQVDKDGGSDAFGRCQSYFRNPNKEAWFEVIYKDGMLSVGLDATSSGQFITCVTPHAVPLQPGYFFGISATTGGLSDNHDFYGLQTYSLGGRVGDEHPLVRAGWKVLEESRARNPLPVAPPAQNGWVSPPPTHEPPRQEQTPPEIQPEPQPPQQEQQVQQQEHQQQYQQQEYQPQHQQQPPPVDLTPLTNMIANLRTDLLQKFNDLDSRLSRAEAQMNSLANRPSGSILTSDQAGQLADIQNNARSISQVVNSRLGPELEQLLRAVQTDVSRIHGTTTDISRKTDSFQMSLNSLRDSVLAAIRDMGGYGSFFWFSLVQGLITVIFVFWKRGPKSEKFF